ncbi:MAG: hypothetical protein ABFS86_18925 [Planctomycetota bacterium]
MKTALIVFGFLGAGLIGAVAARELFPAPVPSTAPPPELAALGARVDDLSGQVERLAEELRVLRDAGVVPSALPPLPSAGKSGSVPGATAPSEAPAPAITEERIEKKVEETIAKIARERQEEKARWVEKETRKKERDWLLQKQKELGLTDYQVDEFAKLLVYRRERLATLKAGWEQATPEQQVQRRTEMEDLSRELHGELRKLLSAQQYEAVMESKDRGK